MTLLIVWMSTHRALLSGLLALSTWVAAYYVYLRYDVRKYFHARRPHHWSVDMAAKTSKGGTPTPR
jgi:hypothetical protein